jgi:hypothetical protein
VGWAVFPERDESEGEFWLGVAVWAKALGWTELEKVIKTMTLQAIAICTLLTFTFSSVKRTSLSHQPLHTPRFFIGQHSP